MYNFVLKQQPKTYNSRNRVKTLKRGNYKSDIESAFLHFNSLGTTLTEDLYGILYYFFRKDLRIDADNISKPLWDCLTSFLFVDDNQVKIRTAGTFDLTKNDVNVLDFSGLSGEVIKELLDAFVREEHVIYVECGRLNNSMFKFNVEVDGN